MFISFKKSLLRLNANIVIINQPAIKMSLDRDFVGLSLHQMRNEHHRWKQTTC